MRLAPPEIQATPLKPSLQRDTGNLFVEPVKASTEQQAPGSWFRDGCDAERADGRFVFILPKEPFLRRKVAKGGPGGSL